MPILDEGEFQKLKEVLDLPPSENNPDEIYNIRQWCKVLVSRLERKQKEIVDMGSTLFDLRKRNALLIQDKQRLEELLNEDIK
jgi:hypothetical protein